ncbi:GNAT family N-acetyltransferase [Bartonella raoultii]|uniref:N-acetyltransferase n=1 Tax=Bartonella raoultii TaxID=1457020 RepID=A0ABS7I556_9HYPH|nr:N-acetyltransferase [Bartonella raoultii]MBX4335171.1 N-acetyltransferase [Bartonella raoultii]
MNVVNFQTKNGVYFTISCEKEADRYQRELLLDSAMGLGRKRKSSETLRRGRLAAKGLSFVVKNTFGELVGSVRLWHVCVCKEQNKTQKALLLGPLAVSVKYSGMGIGSILVRHAIERAKKLGHGAIFLVGDLEFYKRFGFSNSLTENLAMPGPYEKHRFQALELIPQYLSACHGTLTPSGKRECIKRFRHHKVA